MLSKKKNILITGCEGFIGSNIAKKLKSINKNYKIIGCGSLNKKEKLKNINKINLLDYWNKKDLFDNLKTLKNSSINTIIHMGACSSTNEWDGEYLIENNTKFTNKLIDYAIKNRVRMIHASSASVYGIRGKSTNDFNNCIPINMYAYSKLISDNYLINKYPKQKYVTSLRFFNVYGMNEEHKIGMASPVHTFNKQVISSGKINLFKEKDESNLFMRDFVSVEDISNLIMELLAKNSCFGVFDAGTSKPTSFQEIALNIKNWWESKDRVVEINKIEFPKNLEGCYQTYTCADMSFIFKKNMQWRPNNTNSQIAKFLEEYNDLL